MSNVSLGKGMCFALAQVKWTCVPRDLSCADPCRCVSKSARAMRKAEWSGSNPTVREEAAAYFQVSLPSPHPISKTRAFSTSTNLWRVFFSNPSGSFCRVIFCEGQPSLNPATKQAVMSRSRPGNTLRIVSLDRIGLPVLRKESNKPPTPINAPPTPTSEKNGLVTP